jgi:CBS domain-containing protein
MLDRKVGCLPVLEGTKLAGIVSESDLLRVLAG